MDTVRKGIYHHFKDVSKEYEVLGVALHTETEELMVVYRPLYETDQELFVRPLLMFTGSVEKPEYSGPRFIYLREVA
ncbi:MAG: DUF1653 domain-containing protein [Patescibacteria group bacterium]